MGISRMQNEDAEPREVYTGTSSQDLAATVHAFQRRRISPEGKKI